MTTLQLRSELKKMIDGTSDLAFLEQVRQLFMSSADDRAAFVEMNRMADLSDTAIEKGEVFTHEEVVKHIRDRRKGA
jgi:hypothetical protein